MNFIPDASGQLTLSLLLDVEDSILKLPSPADSGQVSKKPTHVYTTGMSSHQDTTLDHSTHFRKCVCSQEVQITTPIQAFKDDPCI